jgi:hypothetical protein
MNVNYNELSGFSDNETYGNYMLTFHKKKIIREYFHNLSVMNSNEYPNFINLYHYIAIIVNIKCDRFPFFPLSFPASMPKNIWQCVWIRYIYQQDIAENEYEVICVNDGSTDYTRAIILDYQQRHSTLQLIDLKEKGIPARRGTQVWIMLPENLSGLWMLTIKLNRMCWQN